MKKLCLKTFHWPDLHKPRKRSIRNIIIINIAYHVTYYPKILIVQFFRSKSISKIIEPRLYFCGISCIFNKNRCPPSAWNNTKRIYHRNSYSRRGVTFMPINLCFSCAFAFNDAHNNTPQTTRLCLFACIQNAKARVRLSVNN